MTRVKTLLLVLGFGVLGGLIYKVGPAKVTASLGQVGWGAVLLLLPNLAAQVLDTMGWRRSFRQDPGLPLPTLFWARVAGEAVNLVTPTAYLGGEPVKAHLLRRHGIPFADGLASALASKTMMTITEMGFIILALASISLRLDLPRPILVGAMITVGLGVLIMGFLVTAQQRGLFRGPMGLMRLLPIRLRALEDRRDQIRAVDEGIAQFYRRGPAAVAVVLGIHFLAWGAGVFETLLFLRLLGLRVDLLSAWTIEALSATARAAVFFVPASVGFLEVGHVTIFLGFSLTAEAALAFSVLRRARELLWAGIGLLLLTYWEGGLARLLRATEGSWKGGA